MLNFKNKRITVVGLGLHGGAVGNIRWLHNQGARLTVTDLKTRPELASSLAKLQDLPDIHWALGEHKLEHFTNTDMILQNPGVPRTSEYLNRARELNIPIEMDSSLFFQLSPTPNIFGVTGSKGKSSATHAIAHLMQLKYSKVVTIGTDQTSPLEVLTTLTPDNLVVFELSSWRLESLEKIKQSPQTAIITALYPDHLNTYDSYQSYLDAKKTILRYQKSSDRAILNYDDKTLRDWSRLIKSRVMWFSMGDTIPGTGIFVDRGTITVNFSQKMIPLFPLKTIPVSSDVERRNILPAIFLAFCAGVRTESIKLHIKHMSTLSHRLEQIRVLNDVIYINDSAATIPEATIAALQSLRGKHVVHIMGGSDKKLNFEKLARAEREARIRSIIFLPGNATYRMKEVVTAAYATPPPMHNAKTMTQAVELAAQESRPGDVVILSPGATSFGLFKHEFDRGDQFKSAVMSLPT